MMDTGIVALTAIEITAIRSIRSAKMHPLFILVSKRVFSSVISTYLVNVVTNYITVYR